MKKIVLKLLRLFLGLFLYATGIVMTIYTNLGLSPWDVFHGGLSKTLSITMGQASMGVGFLIVALNFAFNERIGWGTICNMIFIGIFMDILMLNGLIPKATGIPSGILMMMLGMLLIGIASWLYLGAELGSGPRDGLMVALTKRTGKSVRLIRSSIEIAVLLTGFLMGGYLGVGTFIMAFAIGPCVQFVFRMLRFDVKGINHRYIDEDIRLAARLAAGRKDVDGPGI